MAVGGDRPSPSHLRYAIRALTELDWSNAVVKMIPDDSLRDRVSNALNVRRHATAGGDA